MQMTDHVQRGAIRNVFFSSMLGRSNVVEHRITHAPANARFFVGPLSLPNTASQGVEIQVSPALAPEECADR